MSETETIKGKLTEVASYAETFADKIYVLKNNLGVPLKDYDVEIEDNYICESTGYTYSDGKLYSIERQNLNSEDIFEATKCADGSIDFLLQYYNGGCGFGEALKTALNKLNKDSK